MLTPQVRDQVLAVGRVNAASYEHDLSRWFTPAQIDRLYERNPDWARLERELYGDLTRVAGEGPDLDREVGL